MGVNETLVVASAVWKARSYLPVFSLKRVSSFIPELKIIRLCGWSVVWFQTSEAVLRIVAPPDGINSISALV